MKCIVSYSYVLYTGQTIIIKDLEIDYDFVKDIIFDPEDTMNHKLIEFRLL